VLISPSLLRPPHVTVERENERDHRLKFSPTTKGLHLLHVSIDGHAIKVSQCFDSLADSDFLCFTQGSPFKFNVKPRWRPHHGVWHCCTVCSTGSATDVTCGCGGTTGDGYSGCCHGYQGHPGGHHWSCCGKMSLESECGGHVTPFTGRTPS
ncbi:hypothetical protein EGW08_016773, partial [Elysia chlorotica]